MRTPHGLLTIVAACVACEGVHLRAELPVVDDVPRTVDEAVLIPSPEPASACATECMGGRTCREGACLPHWLPVTAPELATGDARVGHFAVWTGTEVIVWGGYNPRVAGDAGLYGDGYRFDPARNELRRLPSVAAPTPRYAADGQTAVWTGHEMIIWGGSTSDGALADGAAYVPSTDRWVPIASAMAPRAQVTPVFTGGAVVLAGARGPGDAWRWDTSLGSWVQFARGASSDVPRRDHSAVWTGEELLVWGGLDGAGRALSDGWRVSPTRRKSRAIASVGADARSEHRAVWANSEMFVFGGRDAQGRAMASLASYVPATDTWRARTAAHAPSARYEHVAVWTGRSVLVWGGTDGTRTLSDGGEYDPWDDSWTQLPPLDARGVSVAREAAAAVWTGRELLVLGGADRTDAVTPLGWRYQP